MVYSKVGAVAFNVSTGLQSITGLGFQPKLVMFQSCPDTANIVSSIANWHTSFGAYDGSSNAVIMTNARNGVITTDNQSYFSSANSIYIADPPGTSTCDYSAAGNSLDADGFTINITNAPPINYRFGYMAIGGDDILNIKVASLTTKGAVGVQSYTGFGFQPNLLIILSTPAWGGDPVGIGDAGFGIGFANSPAIQYAGHGFTQDGVNPPNGRRSQIAGKIQYYATSSTFETVQANLQSFDADGFTLNYTTHSPVVPDNMIAIAIQGGPGFKSYIGTQLLSPVTGNSVPVITPGINPACGLFASPNTQTLGSHMTFGGYTFGFVDGGKSHYMTSVIQRAFAGLNNALHCTRDDRMYRYLDYTNPTSYVEDVSLSSWDIGGFTLYMNRGNLGGANRVGFLVMEGTTIPPVVSNPSFGYII